MTINELKQVRLHRQHITNKADKQTVCHDLNGLQSQFTVNVYYSLKARCSDDITPQNFGDGLVKNWTVRGTVHAFNECDLLVFKYGTDKYLSRDFDGYRDRKTGEWMLVPERQLHFSDLILRLVTDGVCSRAGLKKACIEGGLTEAEHHAMFHPWGGGIRELCERGFLCHRVIEKKEFMLAPCYEPMTTIDGERELVRRYFSGYAPATIRDAAYYFGWSQTKLRGVMAELPIESVSVEGRDFFYIGTLEGDYPDIPRCVLLAGFDQLMLGYQKTESILLPKEHLRGIFNLQGIVLPPILINGRVVGRWRKKGKKITFELFEKVLKKDQKLIADTASKLYNEIAKVDWN